MRIGKITQTLLVGVIVEFGISGSPTVSAQNKGYVMDGSFEQVHALKENYGTGSLTGVKRDKGEFWYIVEDPEAVDWNVTLTYPRMREGFMDVTTTELPEVAAYYPWGGWAGIIHNGQLFYLSKFVPTYSERYGDYGDYDLFHSALSVPTATYLTKDGVIHKTTVNKIGDYAMAESDIHVIDVILYSDDSGGEDPDLEFGDYVFYNCSKFIGLPEGSPYKVIPNNVTKIGKGVFKGCSAMTRMIIGDKVAVIPEETFDGCSSLKELKLGAGVKEIKCSITGLKRLAISAPTPPSIAEGCRVDAEEIWVPEAYLDTYKSVWAGKNIKPYSFKFRKNPVKAYAGRQADVYFDRVSPGEGENNYVYCYPREKDSNGDQNFLWTVDATHGSNTPSGKFKTVWYSYDCDQRTELAAGNVVYEDLTRVRFDKTGTYKLYYTTLDITNHTEEVTIEVEQLPANYVPVEKITISDAGALNDHTIKVNGTEKLRATIGTANGSKATFDKVTWESSNPDVARINQTEDKVIEITGLMPGETVITARSTDPIAPDVYGTYTLKVVQLMESFILEADYGGVWEEIEKQGNYVLEGIVGETIRIRPVCFPEGTYYTNLYIKDDATYPGQHPEMEIDTVSGTILLKSAGTTQLNIAVRQLSEYKEKPIKLVVSEPGGKVTDIRFKEIETGNMFEYNKGYTGDVSDKVKLRLNYNGDAECKQVVWESSNPEVAEVVPTNQIATLSVGNEPQYHFTVLCKKTGTARVTATSTDGGNFSASFPVTVNKPEYASVKVHQRVRGDAINTVTEYDNTFWFELHKDGTATLVHPSAKDDNGLTEEGIPVTPYQFDYPGRLYIMEHTRRYLWSQNIALYNKVVDEIYFTALKVPSEITVDDKKYTVTAIGDHAFAGSNVVCVNTPETVTSIGDYAFKNAEKFEGIPSMVHYDVIPSSVTELGKGIFSGCTSMVSMRFKDGVSIVPEETFDGCTSLQGVIFGKGVERIECSISATPGYDLSSVVFASDVPPVFAEGCGITVSTNIIRVNERVKDAYEEAFPDLRVISPSLTITSVSHEKAYTRVPITFRYSGTNSGMCVYLEFYPEGTNGAFTHYDTKVSSDFLTWSFDDITAVYDASVIYYSAKSVYISFSKAGKQKIYFRAMGLSELDPVEMEVEIIEGNPVSNIDITAPVYLDVNEVQQLSVTVLPENATNKSYSWSISGDEGVIEVNDKNQIIGLKTGDGKIFARTNDIYGEIKTSPEYIVHVIQSVRDIVVTKDGETVTNTGITGYVGDKYNLSATFAPDNSQYTSCVWSATPAGILKVEGEDKNAVIELIGAGRGVLDVNVSQFTGITSLRRDIPIQVLMPVKTITILKNGVPVNTSAPVIGEVGDEFLFSAEVNVDATDPTVIWSISNPNILEYTRQDKKAKIVLKSLGVAYLRVKAADGKSAEIVIPIVVKDPGEPEPEIPVEIKVENITIKKNSYEGYVGDQLLIDVTVSPQNATNKEIQWVSSNPAIASVSAAGVISLIAEGEVQITGTAKDGSGVSAICTVKVKARPDSEKPGNVKVEIITIKENSHKGYPGDQFLLEPTVYPENATDKGVLWESSNEAVATVTADGLVALISEGEAVITGTAKDGSGVSAKCTVTVEARPVIPSDIKVERIEIQKNSHEGFEGDQLLLEVNVYPENATNQDIHWESSDENVASVTSTGLITLIHAGAANIVGTAKDGSGVNVTCAVKVNARPTGIDGVNSDNKLVLENSQFTINGLNKGDIVSVYSISGTLIDRQKCNGDSVSFSISNKGIYIIVTPYGSFKVRL